MRLLWSIQQKHFSTCPFGANYLAQFWLRAHLSIRNGFRPSLWRAALFFKELAFWAKSLVVKPVSVYGGAIATDVNPAGVLLNEETREEQRAGYLENRGNAHVENLCVPESNGEVPVVPAKIVRHISQ